MAAASAIREAFHEQANACRRLGSAFTGLLLDTLGHGLDETSATGRRVLGWEGDATWRGDALALRVAGALHALVRSGSAARRAALYPPAPLPDAETLAGALVDAVAANDERIAAFLDSPPQTNEIGRSGFLFPGLMTIARLTGRPLDLNEIGSSAGLNLGLDRFRYTLGGAEVGDPSSGVHLRPTWVGSPPTGPAPRIVGRRGCDRSPVDVASAEQRERLMAYIWPDQSERVARTAAAIEIARADPPTIERADAADWVERMAARAPVVGVARVLMHSITFQYFPTEARARIGRAMADAGAAATNDSPLAWLAFEHDPASNVFALTLKLWPHGIDATLATGDAHGWTVRWQAAV